VSLDGKPPRELLPEFLNNFLGSRTGLNLGWHPDGQHISVLGQHIKLGLGFWTLPIGGGASVKSDRSPEVEQQIRQASLEFSDFVWAPSGQALYLEGISKGVKNLWKIGVDPKNLGWISGPERLTTGPGADTEIAISPDGKKLAFNARTERTRVWLAAFDAAKGRTKGEWQPVTSADKDAWSPALSPDGRKLAFMATRSGDQDFWEQSVRDLWVKSLDDGVESLLAGGDGYARFRPTWAPDSQRLAYRRGRVSEPTEPRPEPGLVVKTVGGNEEEIPITAGSFNEFVFDWSANGDSLLGNFRNEELGPVGLCLFPIAAAPRAETQSRIITSHPNKSLWQMNFSPDQHWISFNALNLSGPTNSIIYVIPASGGEWIPITDGKYWCDKPRWAPDGKTIYYTSNRTGFSNIWGIRFDLQTGGPVGEPFQVTDFQSPSRMISQVGALAEISLTKDRLALDITEMSGNIWILDKIDE
jgi:Tol biopolymer transport system component